jgi:hypothetical protein
LLHLAFFTTGFYNSDGDTQEEDSRIRRGTTSIFSLLLLLFLGTIVQKLGERSHRYIDDNELHGTTVGSLKAHQVYRKNQNYIWNLQSLESPFAFVYITHATQITPNLRFHPFIPARQRLGAENPLQSLQQHIRVMFLENQHRP